MIAHNAFLRFILFFKRKPFDQDNLLVAEEIGEALRLLAKALWLPGNLVLPLCGIYLVLSLSGRNLVLPLSGRIWCCCFLYLKSRYYLLLIWYILLLLLLVSPS